MSGASLHHRLAAILVADAVGYSRLMASDDCATLTALDAARAVIRAQIESQQGRVIDMAGDSVLAIFGTASGAVAAALVVQAQLNAQAETEASNRQMRFRIGLHLGDVIEKNDGTVYGDGVNIAARLQTLAGAGGICVSESVRTAVKGRVPAIFDDMGEHAVKNFPDPVRAWRVLAEDRATEHRGARAVERKGSACKPAIAVLPFKVLSTDPKLGFLADGLVEDVIALLARVAGFELISQSSSFAFRGLGAGVASIAFELGVRYGRRR
ncbi:adenylate/guanylate cyclase domain-containing protein [Variovorax sp. J22R24]|uniref:adenylate/guanylate cyclase domain-containing protein n=1 Tax=Variovorax gracilis TaxID=3053502 RepID=UPI0025780B45|nr:adenylate/guanylate cyclase domain-containing protein [Variovorax sp. J22R24]MDM0108120.1 adenylate/guanylate cyclase domain-containing protein [Variovorax sp. J22R24]